MAWELVQCAWRERTRLNSYLKDGWEPFAVSESDAEPTLWLRRSATSADAGIFEPPEREPPRRPRMESEVGR